MKPAKPVRLLLLGCLLGIFGCSGESQIAPVLNHSAALSGELPANPLQWRVITAAIVAANDPSGAGKSLSTLFGNDLAVDYARAHSGHDYPDGSVLALVTWNEREDPRWFGGLIPDRPSSVEFLTIGTAPDGRASYSYTNYTGAPLRLSSSQPFSKPSGRAAFVLSLRSAVLP